MAKLKWDEEGERFYETGVKQGVLYVYDETTNQYGAGVAWNGLTGVTESPSGAEASAQYADDIKYLELYSNEEFGLTIEAFQSPVEFDACDGSAELVAGSGIRAHGQQRKKFAFSYVTTIGNDTLGNDYGYKIHIVYGCRAGVSERSRTTMNDSPEAATLSWEVTTTGVTLEGFKPISHIEINSKDVAEAKLTAIKTALYGSDTQGSTEGTEAHVLLPADIIDLLNRN